MADQRHDGEEEETRPPVSSLRAPRADGLERFYDVCIVGTGLVEAMLSACVLLAAAPCDSSTNSMRTNRLTSWCI